VGGWERRSWKNSPTTADRAVQTECGETTAAGGRNGDGRGDRERGVMLTDGFETGNG
jgi:hypothetical protein